MISKENAQKVAKLARLGITESETEKFKAELSAVLDYFKMINKADVLKVEPTFQATESFLSKDKLVRSDKAMPENEQRVEKIIEAFPEKEGRYTKVKAVL